MLTKTKQEALCRLQKIEDSLANVNPNIRKYLEDDKLYYPYLTGGGLLGSIDTISYNPHYEEVVRKFEHDKGKFVYHVIETGDTLAFLYVTIPTDSMCGENLLYEWEEERLFKDNSILAYVYNFEEPSFSEIGYITIDIFTDSGALVRTF